MRLDGQQIRSLAGGFILMMVSGSTYIFGTLVPYLNSYIYYSGNKDIHVTDLMTILIAAFICLNIGVPISNFKWFNFSNRVVCLITVLGVTAMTFLASYLNTYIEFFIFYGGVYPLFVGYGYMAPMKNCFQHIPTKKGLCSGVCFLGYGISATIFNLVLLKLVNPDNVSPLADQDNRYPEEIANRLPNAFKILSAIYLGIGLIGVFLIREKQQKNNLLEDERSNEHISSINKGLVEQKRESSETNTPVQDCKYFVKKNIIQLMIMMLTSTCFGIFVAFSYKDYGLLYIKDDAFLTLVGSVGSISSGLGRLFWGTLMDKFSYKILSTAINLVLLAGAIAMPYSTSYEPTYLILVVAVFFCYGGLTSVYPAQTMKVFGGKTGPKIYYIVFTGYSVSVIAQYLIRKIFVGDTTNQQQKKDGFMMGFYVFAGLNLIALLLSVFVKFEDHPDELKLKYLQKQKRISRI